MPMVVNRPLFGVPLLLNASLDASLAAIPQKAAEALSDITAEADDDDLLKHDNENDEDEIPSERPSTPDALRDKPSLVS